VVIVIPGSNIGASTFVSVVATLMKFSRVRSLPQAAPMPAMTERRVSEFMAASEKQPGEKAPGKYHYNPGNMSGKTVKTGEEGSEKKNDESRDEAPKEHL
jgi:hypothetical protein